MQRAGRATAEAAPRDSPRDTGAPILVVAGPGNNGGDAWVAAAHLRESFHRVTVLDVAGTAPRAPEAREARDRFLAARRQGRCASGPRTSRPALVVDGLLGIGLARDVEGAMARLIAAHQRLRRAGARHRRPERPRRATRARVRGVGGARRRTRSPSSRARPGLHTGDGAGPRGRDPRRRPRRGPGAPRRCRRQPPHAGSVARRGSPPRARDTHKGILRHARHRRRRQGHDGCRHPRGARGAPRRRGQGLRRPPRPRRARLRPGHAGADAAAPWTTPSPPTCSWWARARDTRPAPPRSPPSSARRCPRCCRCPSRWCSTPTRSTPSRCTTRCAQALAASRRAPTILTPAPRARPRGCCAATTAEVQADRLAAARSPGRSRSGRRWC